MDLLNLNAEVINQKVAYPHEKLNLSNFQEPLNLTKKITGQH